MNVLSQSAGYLLIVLFGLSMILLTYFASRNVRWETGTGFLVAWRDVPWPLAAPSIAASWIWAPALFVSVQKAYELGLPGIFWFTLPNVLALVVYAFLGPKIRNLIPCGYTLPDWISLRFGKKVHRVYMVPYIWYQIMAVTVQIFVGGMMLNYLTGIPLNFLMILLLVVCLIYSLISGLRASVITDFVQLALMIVGALTIPVWVANTVGWDLVWTGLGGVAGNTNILDPHVAFSFGIVTSIGLIAGAISDQQYWQRAFAIKRTHLVKAYVVGGVLFGIVPLFLSMLGFVAASPASGILMPQGVGLPMIGIEVVVKFLPLWATVCFVIMLLCGLMSTLDSGMCAASSLYAIDIASMTLDQRKVIFKEKIGETLTEVERNIKNQIDQQTIKNARVGMFVISGLGLLLAFFVQYLFSLDRLWWIFNGVATCFVVPTVMSLYHDRVSEKGVLYGIYGSIVGMVAFIYGNWIQSDVLAVVSALFIIGVSLICCLSFRRGTAWTLQEVSGE